MAGVLNENCGGLAKLWTEGIEELNPITVTDDERVNSAGTTISTIAVQSGSTRVVLAVLQVNCAEQVSQLQFVIM